MVKLKDLEIVGYCDPSPEYLRPGFLAAIFKNKTSGDIILPGYKIINDNLEGGSLDSESALEKMVWLRSAVKFDTPITPKEGFVLWVDEEGKIKYDSREETKTFLQKYSEEKLFDARKALQANDYQKALSLAQRAFNADENCVDALKVKQEVYRKQGNKTFVDELGHLINSIEK